MQPWIINILNTMIKKCSLQYLCIVIVHCACSDLCQQYLNIHVHVVMWLPWDDINFPVQFPLLPFPSFFSLSLITSRGITLLPPAVPSFVIVIDYTITTCLYLITTYIEKHTLLLGYTVHVISIPGVLLWFTKCLCKLSILSTVPHPVWLLIRSFGHLSQHQAPPTGHAHLSLPPLPLLTELAVAQGGHRLTGPLLVGVAVPVDKPRGVSLEMLFNKPWLMHLARYRRHHRLTTIVIFTNCRNRKMSQSLLISWCMMLCKCKASAYGLPSWCHGLAIPHLYRPSAEFKSCSDDKQ